MSDCIVRIARILNENLLLEVASPDTDLLDSGLLDSMALVELLLNLEREFGFRLDMEHLDMESFRSISRIAELLEGTAGRAEAR